IGEQEVLGDLLGDGGGALRATAAAVLLYVERGGARDAGEVDAAVFVEILVLGRDESVGDELGHRLDRNIEPPLARIFGEQRAVGGMPRRNDGGLIVRRRRVAGKGWGVVPQQAGARRDRGNEYDRSRREQQAEEAQQPSHGRKSPCPRPLRPR